MTRGLEAFLGRPACFEMKDEYLEQYGRISPYIFRTPTPLRADQLQVIGANGSEMIVRRASGRPVHLIGVASRGIPLATAMTIDLGTARGVEADLSTVNQGGSLEHVATGQAGYTVVVDNALVSGRTMDRTLARVRAAGVKVDLVIYLFDREELNSHGMHPAEEVAAKFGCDVASIFSLREVIDAIGSEAHRNILLEYAREFGTASLKMHLSGVS